MLNMNGFSWRKSYIKLALGVLILLGFLFLTSANRHFLPAGIQVVSAECDNGNEDETSTDKNNACSVNDRDTTRTGHIVRQYTDNTNCNVTTDDTDWYRFELRSSDSIVLTVSPTGGSSGSDFGFNLYAGISPDILIRSVDGSPTATTAFEYNQSQNFYIEVFNEGCSASSTEDKFGYQLTFDYYFQEDEESFDNDDGDDGDDEDTPAPTATPQPTPELGGPEDISEPNNIWAQAFRLVPGNTINLNFNSGTFGVEDIDYFVMKVSAETPYVCETNDLGLATDTILAVYGPQPNDLSQIGVNDDIDPSSGEFNSRVRWESVYEGEVWIIVRQNGEIQLPGRATYELTCEVDLGLGLEDIPFIEGGGNFTVPDASTLPGANGSREAISVLLLRAPANLQPQIEYDLVTTIVDIVLGYDGNANGIIEPNEGVSGVSIRVVDPRTNNPLTQGFTNEQGSIRVVQSVNEEGEIQVLVPYLSLGREFAAGSDGQWQVVIPNAVLPPIIP